MDQERMEKNDRPQEHAAGYSFGERWKYNDRSDFFQQPDGAFV